MAHQEARRRAMAAVADAPAGSVITIGEPTRNLGQNAALHALLSEIADSCEWAGRKWDAEVWKRLLTASWSRAEGEPVTILPALDGNGVEIVFRRTSTLTRAECSSLLDYVQAWAAENMVTV